LQRLLEEAPKRLKSGGRFVVLTFMSLEDRKVKQSFQALARTGRAKILTKHVVKPTEEEISVNAASRSAKLRAIEMANA
jgi:16S rRNA (cytosine1402-N4)-methyltransferase